MRFRKLGWTGEEIPVIGMGTWAIGGDMWGPVDEKESIATIRAAIDHGMVLVDTAALYGGGVSEKVVGKAIEGIRDRVFLATKCGLKRVRGEIVRDLSPGFIREEINASLRRLNVDHVDLYQCHWPVTDTPIEETMAVLDEIVKEGKVRFYGVSNFERDSLDAAARAGSPVSLQSEYSLVRRDVEKQELALCLERGLGFLAYGPMGGGLLTGKYDMSGPPPKFPPRDARSFFYQFFGEPGWSEVGPLVQAVEDAAHELGCKPGHVAVAWVLAQPGVTCALVGAKNPAQAIENAKAADVELPAEITSILGAPGHG